MKAELVENIIVAHCSGNEQQFSDALYALVKDEEKKGNIPTAARFRKAYEQKRKAEIATSDHSVASSNVFFSQSSQAVAPRDKDSLLELYEIVYSKTSFDDVVLPSGQKTIIQRFIDEQNNAVQLKKHNIPAANRLLLCGPPGCGKTMTAYAIGNALKLPIAYVRLDGLVSSYLGQTSTNLRKVFDSVKNQRIILFLDEFDAIAKKRDDSNELGELKRVVTTLLQNFDNLPDNVILIAATNHEHLLDPAIWRRFNFTITLDLPTAEQRKALIQNGLMREGMSGALIDELILAAAKKKLLDGILSTADITEILIQQKTKYSDSGDEAMKVICDMLDRGVSLRTAASALGISHSTLEYQVKKYRGDE